MRRLNPIRRALTVALALAAAPFGSAWAQDGNALLRVRSLAATCAQCHGTEGRPPAGSIVPALAGTSGALLIQRMNEFKAGTLPGTVMPQLAKGYSDAQIRQLAAYFAAQPR